MGAGVSCSKAAIMLIAMSIVVDPIWLKMASLPDVVRCPANFLDLYYLF